jgi:molybdenum cofactor synthesis domain-containing protein
VAAPPIAELLAVGRELLTGRTVDTNSAWLAGRLTARGASVSRIVVVDDDPDEIAAALRSARQRGARLVITTGGLGPTFDDRTLLGVAAALEQPLVEHEAALAMVTRRYAELAARHVVADTIVTPARRKMAFLPAGAEPLDNPVGTAPGVLCTGDGFVVLSLPGVPSEMRGLFDVALPRLGEVLAGGREVAETELDSGSSDESAIAATVERVMAKVPGVWIKSLPQGFETDRNLRIRVTAFADDRSAAERRLAEAVRLLGDALPSAAAGEIASWSDSATSPR